MPVLTKEEYMERLKKLIGDDSSDDALKVIEDFSETYDSFQKTESEDWKKKYEENDAEWRKKYKERFFAPAEEVKEETDEEVKEESKEKTFDDLFEEKKGE